MTAAAEVDSDVRTVLVTFVGAPDEQEKHTGRPFVVEHGRVSIDHERGRRVYVILSGRAIRKDGEIGKATRFRAYNLDAANWLERAPEWLRTAINTAGVVW